MCRTVFSWFAYDISVAGSVEALLAAGCNQRLTYLTSAIWDNAKFDCLFNGP
jgi:hypothetical protein